MIHSLTKTLAKVMATAIAVCLLAAEVFACPPPVAPEPKSHEEWQLQLEDAVVRAFGRQALRTLTASGLAPSDADAILAQLAQDAAKCWYDDVLQRQESRNVEVLAATMRDYLLLYDNPDEHRDVMMGCVESKWVNAGLDPADLN